MISPAMGHADPRRSRSAIQIPANIIPATKNRIFRSIPEDGNQIPDDTWLMATLGEELSFLAKTGSQNDSQRAISAMALMQAANPAQGRAGKPPTAIQMGGLVDCVDFSPQTVSVGDLTWAKIDYGDILPSYLAQIKARGISVFSYTPRHPTSGFPSGAP